MVGGVITFDQAFSKKLLDKGFQISRRFGNSSTFTVIRKTKEKESRGQIFNYRTF